MSLVSYGPPVNDRHFFVAYGHWVRSCPLCKVHGRKDPVHIQMYTHSNLPLSWQFVGSLVLTEPLVQISEQVISLLTYI
jgi:hypothetical protein